VEAWSSVEASGIIQISLAVRDGVEAFDFNKAKILGTKALVHNGWTILAGSVCMR
jgi:hypothetical protein